MPWFAAHAIAYFEFSDGHGGDIPVWENVVLVNAPDRETAARTAEQTSREGEGGLGGHAMVGGRPGSVVFAGVRKVESVLIGGRDPGNGDEISYVELTAPDLASVTALANGEAVQLVCDRILDDRPWAVRDRNL